MRRYFSLLRSRLCYDYAGNVNRFVHLSVWHIPSCPFSLMAEIPIRYQTKSRAGLVKYQFVLMQILTPPWLLFSLRGRRKRCQHDPGSRLWRGSGGKSKTLSIRSPRWRAALTVVLLTFPVKIPLTYRDTNTDDSSLWPSIVSRRGSEDDRMLFGHE